MYPLFFLQNPNPKPAIYFLNSKNTSLFTRDTVLARKCWTFIHLSFGYFMFIKSIIKIDMQKKLKHFNKLCLTSREFLQGFDDANSWRSRLNSESLVEWIDYLRWTCSSRMGRTEWKRHGSLLLIVFTLLFVSRKYGNNNGWVLGLLI